MNEEQRIKILTLSDHPLSPSGVGTQTRYMIEGLLDTNKYDVISLGGAIKHNDYTPQKTDKYGDHWRIFPVDNYGTQEHVRQILRAERPDIIWFMTDPRFWPWLWDIENEIRPMVPLVYYHVWDNFPPPRFNQHFYESNDVIVTISKVTDEIVKQVAPNVKRIHLPHAVTADVFKPFPEEEIQRIKGLSLADHPQHEGKLMFFWNNRNARRKQSGTLIWWFKEWLDKVGHDKAYLIMHTDPKDPNGQDLQVIIKELGLSEGQVLLSTAKYPPQELAAMYNMADCTINISDAEGFGLATLESLSCGTPIIVNMTGGLQEQVTNGKDWFGIGIEPSSKAIIGSQAVPWIYEDRVSKEDFLKALDDIYAMSDEERKALGAAGRKHVLKNYGFEKYQKEWDKIMSDIHEQNGSWKTRKNYKSWEHLEF